MSLCIQLQTDIHCSYCISPLWKIDIAACLLLIALSLSGSFSLIYCIATSECCPRTSTNPVARLLSFLTDFAKKKVLRQ